ncbi:hypothetical protein [Sphingomonas desiccabilis]|uniref:Uncharacterized protein n=1 Tax=Sphingomonas desiccabilis TaxID=429134 RepID=A0A4Q2IZP4_9SPHN|nr:hypothetical protein [Sphingomonas desiccabilis]MBB3910164.1 hypothetical protein [Sphingomonas desiccabilis]RXZ34843.1 hypothetical protein EO081_04065 [Sphingomonas desiccabilis]
MSNLVLSEAEQDAIEQGEAAGLLLDHPMFLRAIEAVRLQCAEAILMSEPAAQQSREDAYNLSRGLSAITAELAALAARGEQVLAEAEAQTESDDPDEGDTEPAPY